MYVRYENKGEEIWILRGAGKGIRCKKTRKIRSLTLEEDGMRGSTDMIPTLICDERHI